MVEAVGYVSRKLGNPVAAERLARDLIEAGDSILDFPYANAVYTSIRPLKREYRAVRVHSYLMFYWVDEGKKTVTIARVIYGKRDYGRLLD